MGAYKILISLIFFGFVAQSQAASICERDNSQQLQAGKGTFQSLNDLFSQVGKQSNLHIFGEEHYYTNRDLLAGVIQQLSPTLRGQDKCLFLELPKGGLELLAQRFRDLQSQVKSPADQAQLDLFSKYYPSMVSAAKSQGMKVFEIDHPDHFSGEKTENERNQAMAATAVELLTKGQCESAILFVGKAHISPLEFDKKSLKANLLELGLKPVTYHIVDVQDPAPSPLWSWSRLCQTPATVPAAFSNSILSPNTAIYPLYRSERKALWNDFDYSILRGN